MKPNITIKQVDPKGPSVTAQLGDGYAVPTVTGGWQATARPRSRSISEWSGQDLITMDVPILLDGFLDNTSVESEVRQLFSYMRDIVGKRDEPPVLHIHGVPLPFSNLDWVLNAITPGDEIRRHKDGHRVRAAMTLSFLEHREGDIVINRKTSPAKKHQKRSGERWVAGNVNTATATRTYTVRKGDTLSKIAAHELGSASRWHEIKKLNSNIRDPNNLKVGSKLKLPKK